MTTRRELAEGYLYLTAQAALATGRRERLTRLAPHAETPIAARAAWPAAGASEQRAHTPSHRTCVDQARHQRNLVARRPRVGAPAHEIQRWPGAPDAPAAGPHRHMHGQWHAHARPEAPAASEAAQGCVQGVCACETLAWWPPWGHGACEERGVVRGRTADTKPRVGSALRV